MGTGCWRVGSLPHDTDQNHHHKTLQHNALCRQISGGFWSDNPVVGWVRYGLDCVREADANGDCGVMWPGIDAVSVRRG